MILGLRQDNPYAIGTILTFTEGEDTLNRPQLKHVKSPKDILHTVTDWDNLWNLSYDYYGTSKYYWVIQDINEIENAFELDSGTNIIIPDLDLYKAAIL